MMRFCALSSHGTSAPKAHKFPDATTFGRIFRLFSPGRCVELAEVENEARRKVWPKKWFGKITLDMDSTVHGVYGSQEASEQGYNPNPPDCCRQGGQEKKGKKVITLRWNRRLDSWEQPQRLPVFVSLRNYHHPLSYHVHFALGYTASPALAQIQPWTLHTLVPKGSLH